MLKHELTLLRNSITPETWTQGAYARDRDGRITLIDDPKACRRCLLGHICHLGLQDVKLILAHHISRTFDVPWTDQTSPIPYFNDHLANGVDDIHTLIDEVIVNCPD